MKLSVLIDQSLGLDRRVNLRGRNIGVSEHFLDRTQIGSAIEQMSGKGMSQQMRLHRLGDPSELRAFFHNQPQRHARKPTASGAQKEMAARARFHEMRTPRFQPDRDGITRLLPDRHHPLFGALAENPQEPLLKIDLLDRQLTQFGNP